MTAKQGVLPLKQDASGGGTVTSVSVAAANGFAGTVANPTSAPDITIQTTVTGILNGNGTAVSAATGADLPAMTSTVGGAVPTPPNDATKFLNGTGAWSSAGTGTVTNTGTLTANQLVIGNGSADVKVLGSAGTTTTVLHGNAAGAPTFGAVSLTADVSGTLPVGNGGTGLTTGTSGGVLAFTGSGTIASSGALTANRLVLGGGAGAAPTVMASAGTTTTVLHGNASGAPTFGAVSLTADVTGTLPVANGGTGVATLTAYAPIFGGTTGTGAVQSGTVGSAGQVLTSNGAGALPTFQNAAGGGSWVYIGSATATPGASSFAINSGFSSTYDVYVAVLSNFTCSSTQGSVNIQLEIGGSFQTSGYRYSAEGTNSSGGVVGGGTSVSDTNIYVAQDLDGTSAAATAEITFYIYLPADTTVRKQISWIGSVNVYNGGTRGIANLNGSGDYSGSTSALTGIRVYPGARTVQGGTWRLYGIKNS